MVTRYQKRVSGPLLDRIDIHIEVPRVEYQRLSDDRLESAAASRTRRSGGIQALPGQLYCKVAVLL